MKGFILAKVKMLWEKKILITSSAFLTLYPPGPKNRKPCPSRVNPSPNNPTITTLISPSRTLWEKEKMLVTSIFSFSNNGLYFSPPPLPPPTPHGKNQSDLLLYEKALKLDQPKNSSACKGSKYGPVHNVKTNCLVQSALWSLGRMDSLWII